MEHENKSNYPVHVKNKSEYKKSSLPHKEVSEDTEQIFLRGVHCDEISTGWIEFDVFALKHEPKVLAVFGLFDHQICWATTDRTSRSIRLNSSKQHQLPD